MGILLQNPTINVSSKASVSQGNLQGKLNQASAIQLAVASGAGVLPIGNVDLVYAGEGVVAYGSPVAITLTNVMDPGGNVVTFARIVSIHIRNTGGLDGNAGYDLTVGNGTNPWSADVSTINCQGEFLNVSPTGFGLAANSGDTITLTAPAGATGSDSVPYEIVVFGRST
jgi:hypothetical protein